MKKILVNRIRCNKCGDIIESTHRHDFKFCKCGAVAVDGGHDYLRRSFKEKDCYIELSITENKECSISEGTCKSTSYLFFNVSSIFLDKSLDF